MWSLLLNFLNYAMGKVFRALVIKFVVYSVIIAVVAGLAAFIFEQVLNVNFLGLKNMIGGLPDGLLFFMVYFQFHIGLPLVFGAAIAKFTIRRIPVIG